MAHFAEIKDGLVTNVIVVNNSELLVDGVEVESKGREFCHNLLGGEWIQTSYNANFRNIYAGIGCTYNADDDVFIAPQPFPSWTLDSNHKWQPPTPKPEGFYLWNEELLSWVAIPVG